MSSITAILLLIVNGLTIIDDMNASAILDMMEMATIVLRKKSPV